MRWWRAECNLWWKLQHLVRKKEQRQYLRFCVRQCLSVYVLVCLNVSHLLLYWSLKYLIESLRALVSYEWSFLGISVCFHCLFCQILISCCFICKAFWMIAVLGFDQEFHLLPSLCHILCGSDYILCPQHMNVPFMETFIHASRQIFPGAAINCQSSLRRSRPNSQTAWALAVCKGCVSHPKPMLIWVNNFSGSKLI